MEMSMASGDDTEAREKDEREGNDRIPSYLFMGRDVFQSSFSSVDGTRELMHASNISSGSQSSTIQVEIADIDGADSLNLTTTTLKRCKEQVLRPYWRLLMFIGWRGFGRESVNFGSKTWKVFSHIYLILVMTLLIYTYFYEILACQWKLDVNKDTQVATTTHRPRTTTSNTTGNITIFPFPFVSFIPGFIMQQNLSKAEQKEPPLACQHIVTTYIIPNLLHFVAYILGLCHFRIKENEQLYALMEKVFLQAANLHSQTASQQRMIRKLRLFIALGVIWVMLTLGLQGLYIWAFDFPQLALFKTTGPSVHWLLFAFMLFGIMLLHSVNLAVVVNYATQCEMILFYVRGITLRLQEKSTDMRTAMKDILLVRQNLSLLNGPIANMTSLVTVILCELTIIGISILVVNENNVTKIWVYRGLFPIVWLVMLCFPLFQAARVNSICRRIRKIALEMRVFGYKNCSQLELDSFLMFSGSTRLRAKLFHIPILPSYLIAILVSSAFVILILFQTSVIGHSNYLF